MIPYAACRIDAAQARTGVLTLLIDAGLVRGAVGVDDTFRPTVGRRAYHGGQAGALALLPNCSGRIAVGTARIRLAGVNCHHGFDG